jgi:hypothetical protein
MTSVKANLDPDRLSKLQAELSAFELWDSDYYRTKVHDKIDEDSLRVRQKRREEVLDEILGIFGADPRMFRLSFHKVE